MGRKILFITTDQQRYDALGCNGGRIARTPVVDRLAAAGINYHRAHKQNVVCMPAYDGCEGELYDVREDPHQWRNLWGDARFAELRSDLVADLYDLPPGAAAAAAGRGPRLSAARRRAESA